MPLAEAQKMREVAVVTHELFLQKLGKFIHLHTHQPKLAFHTQLTTKAGWNYKHAQVGTFRINPDVGKLIPITANELPAIRAEQAKWAKALEARQIIKKAEIEERFKQAVADAVAQALKTAETQLQMLKLDIRSVESTSVQPGEHIVFIILSSVRQHHYTQTGTYRLAPRQVDTIQTSSSKIKSASLRHSDETCPHPHSSTETEPQFITKNLKEGGRDSEGGGGFILKLRRTSPQCSFCTWQHSNNEGKQIPASREAPSSNC